MDTNKILSSDLLDLVFDDRNKSYGAYELRRTYPERVKRSLLITAAIATIVFGGAVLGNTLKPSKVEIPKDEVTVIDLTPTDDVEPEVIPPQKQQAAAAPAHTVAFSTPIITPDPPDEPMPTTSEVAEAIVGLENNPEGPADEAIVALDGTRDKKGLFDDNKKEGDEILTSVQIPARYDGNWERFLLKYLNGNVPVDHGAAAGRYKVIIQFVVDKDGKVSDLVPLTNVGFGMEQEAMRVLKKADKWKAGIQNGFPVKAYHKQVIVFEVNEE
jgi:periplasmic protein TonB